MYDVIVIGARCAGSPTAMLLARKGYRVLLIDKATFPSDVVRSTHFVHQPGVARLKRWGLLTKVENSGCPAIVRWMLNLGPARLTGAPPPVEGVAQSYAPRRVVLDQILLEAAIAGGAEFREGCTLQDVLWENGRAVGIKASLNGGCSFTARGSLIVGADGTQSKLAKIVCAREYHVRPPLLCTYWTYWSGVQVSGVELYVQDRRIIWAYPTNADLTISGVCWPAAEAQSVRADIEGNCFKVLEIAPGLRERLYAGKREERWIGAPVVPNFFRKPFGPGWALVGDAGYTKDPCTAAGITDAFCGVEQLMEAIEEAFSQRVSWEAALAAYEQRRNDAALPVYDFICQLASFKPPSGLTAEFYSALQQDQAESDRFIGLLAHTVSVPEYLSPENIQRILAGVEA